MNQFNVVVIDYSGDSFTVLPIDQLGTQYVAVGRVEPNITDNIIIAVAYQDDTMVAAAVLFNSYIASGCI